jgi:hypothetical protein
MNKTNYYGGAVLVLPNLIRVSAVTEWFLSDGKATWVRALDASKVQRVIPRPGAEDTVAEFPEVGTEAWGRMNRRRAELIRKKVRGELPEEEREEYEALQRGSLEKLERAFPRRVEDKE